MHTKSTQKTAKHIGCFLAACIVSLFSAFASAQCPAGELLIAEDENNYYCRVQDDYKGSHGEQLAVDYCKTKLLVAADQNAIRNLGFNAISERFEMFATVSEEQQAEMKSKVVFALFDQGLETTGKLVDKAKSLNPWNVNNAIKTLEENGFHNQQVIAALRRISRVNGKPEMAASYHEFAELAKKAAEGYKAGEAAGKDPGTAQLQILLGALKIMQGNPELGLLVTGAEFAESMAYLGYITGQVDALTSTTDQRLAQLSSMSTRLRAHVAGLNKTQRAWQKEMDIPVAPSCSR